MGTVSTFTFTTDTEQVTRTKLNNLVANLLTEFNGSIENDNIKAGAAIAQSKLSLDIVNADVNASAAIVGSKLDLSTPGIIGATSAAAATFTDLTITSFAAGWTNAGRTIADLGTVSAATSITSSAFVGDLTGKADTADALETSRNINGVGFDGTANITVTADANTLTNTTLKSTVVDSSLTSLGTIASLVATTADINAGTFDGTVGGTTPAAGDFTTCTVVDLPISGEAHFGTEVDNGNSGAADTIDWTAGNKQKSTLTDNVTYTFTNPSGACNLILKVIQDAGGTNTVTWDADVQWAGGTAPTITATGNAVDIVAFYFDGTNYYGSIIQDVS
tara:strand:+ start:3364 stop:4365 length:1002 start_codon:yes stop_codon:yes gene_type:complete